MYMYLLPNDVHMKQYCSLIALLWRHHETAVGQ